eukprot:2465885-Prymnesium_polylepis.1
MSACTLPAEADIDFGRRRRACRLSVRSCRLRRQAGGQAVLLLAPVSSAPADADAGHADVVQP